MQTRFIPFFSLLALFPAICSAAVIHTEDFQVPGIGTGNFNDQSGRYTVQNGFDNRTDFFAIDGSGDPAGPSDSIFTGGNTRAFGGRDLDDVNNPGTPNSVTLTDISIGTWDNLAMTIDVYGDDGSGNFNVFEASDRIRVLADYNGANTFATTLLTISGPIAGSGALTDGTTTVNSVGFTTFSATIPDNGLDLTLRIVVEGMTEGNERFAFDNIEVTADLDAAAIPEPNTLLLLLGGVGCILLRRFKGI